MAKPHKIDSTFVQPIFEGFLLRQQQLHGNNLGDDWCILQSGISVHCICLSHFTMPIKKVTCFSEYQCETRMGFYLLQFHWSVANQSDQIATRSDVPRQCTISHIRMGTKQSCLRWWWFYRLFCEYTPHAVDNSMIPRETIRDLN